MGFVAGDGSFVRSNRRFRFAIAVSALDAELLHDARRLLGVGSIDRVAPRQSHFQPTVIYRVGSIHELLERVCPSVEAHLLPSHKRIQFDDWNRQLLSFWSNDMRRPRQCSVEGCVEPRRAKALCRVHYYDVYRR
jgi:hypothetical protein